MPTAPRCKSCGSTTRKLTAPGPRCQSCHREVQRARRLAAAGRRVQDTYSLTPEQYDALYAAQGGRCALCRRARGTGGKRLAVDHDHACCPGPRSCGRCCRGLVCGPCNDVLAHFRDDPAAFERGAAYLRDWPSRRVGIVPRTASPRRLVVPLTDESVGGDFTYG
jgi:hypothetical protein